MESVEEKLLSAKKIATEPNQSSPKFETTLPIGYRKVTLSLRTKVTISIQAAISVLSRLLSDSLPLRVDAASIDFHSTLLLRMRIGGAPQVVSWFFSTYGP
jgi:hypothetical protein